MCGVCPCHEVMAGVGPLATLISCDSADIGDLTSVAEGTPLGMSVHSPNCHDGCELPLVSAVDVCVCGHMEFDLCDDSLGADAGCKSMTSVCETGTDSESDEAVTESSALFVSVGADKDEPTVCSFGSDELTVVWSAEVWAVGWASCHAV